MQLEDLVETEPGETCLGPVAKTPRPERKRTGGVLGTDHRVKMECQRLSKYIVYRLIKLSVHYISSPKKYTVHYCTVLLTPTKLPNGPWGRLNREEDQLGRLLAVENS